MYEPAPRITWSEASDGYRMASRVWDVDRPAARVVFLHGIISHGGWYLAGCRRLARQKIEVHFLDRRGSGLNTADRGAVDRYSTWIRDVETYLQHLSPGPPTFLLGISWGGKLAAAVAAHLEQAANASPLAGLGLLCPGLYAHKGAGLAAQLALRAAAAVGLGQRRVTIPLRDPALFTIDPRWREYVAADPLTLRQVTVAFALADLELTRVARQSAAQIHVPTLLVLAGQDRIIDNAQVREFLARVPHPDRRVIEYPNATHTIDFESDAARFYDDLAAWVLEVALTPSSPCP
jgi:acylglycerol lipase